MDFGNHPCFNEKLRAKAARIHLPVAPKCNTQCNFCDRKFDCINESRPGVTSSVLNPKQALRYLDSAMQKIPNVTVVGIAGPGDPFANAEETLDTLRLVRARYPEVLLCVASNGLELAPYAADLAGLKVGHVTITVNAATPETAARVYAWVRYGRHIYRGVEAGTVMLREQERSLRLLAEAGVMVKVNVVVIPGVNDGEVEAIAKKTKSLGAGIFNLLPLYSVENTPFAGLAPLPAEEFHALKEAAGALLPLMGHCARCRADAAGLIGQQADPVLGNLLREASAPEVKTGKPFVAVGTEEGVFVNRHLGETDRFAVFALENDMPKLVEIRKAPIPGSGMERWVQLAELLSDCAAVLVSGVGINPKFTLESAGIAVIVMEGMIAESVTAILSGREVPKVLLRENAGCSAGSCGGTGNGCG
jgi:nitrogen fixation protein NifB